VRKCYIGLVRGIHGVNGRVWESLVEERRIDERRIVKWRIDEMRVKEWNA